MRSDIPLANLPAFEAAARHQSFASAADELNLSQAAISRQIKFLEDRLGVALFERSHRAVRLTAEGEQFYHTTCVALRLIGDTVDSIRPSIDSRSMNIATDLAFAHFWLIPRLGFLERTNENLNISVTASDVESDCLTSSVDLPILYGGGEWPGYEARFLLDEEIFPVCNRAYLESLKDPQVPADLLHATLLHVMGGPAIWVNWHEWLAEHRVEIPADSTGIMLNSLPWTIQAACNGQGIALGWKYLCDDLLANGTLVRPIPHSMKTNRGYYMLFRQGTSRRSEAERISDLIIDIRNGK